MNVCIYVCMYGEREREREGVRVYFSVGASFGIWTSAVVIGGFGRDGANGSMRRGEAVLGGNRVTWFNGGGEHGEAAAGDCNGHFKGRRKRGLWVCVSVSLQFQTFIFPYPLVGESGLDH